MSISNSNLMPAGEPPGWYTYTSTNTKTPWSPLPLSNQQLVIPNHKMSQTKEEIQARIKRIDEIISSGKVYVRVVYDSLNTVASFVIEINDKKPPLSEGTEKKNWENSVLLFDPYITRSMSMEQIMDLVSEYSTMLTLLGVQVFYEGKEFDPLDIQ